MDPLDITTDGFDEISVKDYVIKIDFKDASGFVKIMPDGSIEFGGDYTPDKAALAFWAAMAAHFPGIKDV